MSPPTLPGLSRHADLVLDSVVIRLQLLVTERPILDRRSVGDSRCPVSAGRLADHLEVPGVETPALRPVVQRRPTHAVHHRMHRRPRGLGGTVRARRRNLTLRLLDGERPGAHVVPDLVRGKVLSCQPATGLESHDVEPRFSQRERSHATHGAEPHDHHVGSRQPSRHDGVLGVGRAQWPC